MLGSIRGAGMEGQLLLQQSVDCCPQSEVLTDDCVLCVWDKTFGVTATTTTHTTYFVPLVIYEVGAAPLLLHLPGDFKTEHPHLHFQVHLSDRNEDEFEAEEAPTELYLDMSVQENLLENARIGITTLHQCDFQIEDTDNINEDNVFVTGLTVE